MHPLGLECDAKMLVRSLCRLVIAVASAMCFSHFSSMAFGALRKGGGKEGECHGAEDKNRKMSFEAHGKCVALLSAVSDITERGARRQGLVGIWLTY